MECRRLGRSDIEVVAIVDIALDEARRSHADVLIIDTAGRLHVDEAMMQEVVAVHAYLSLTDQALIAFMYKFNWIFNRKDMAFHVGVNFANHRCQCC